MHLDNINILLDTYATLKKLISTSWYSSLELEKLLAYENQYLPTLMSESKHANHKEYFETDWNTIEVHMERNQIPFFSKL